MKALVALAIALLSVPSFAQTVEPPSPLRISRGVRFQPCSFWRHDFNSNSYTCSYLDMRVEVPETREVQNALNTLQRQIEALERRVQALESAQ